MSRSYKKTPIVKDNGEGKKDKKAIANRKVRRRLKNLDYSIADGKAYRKEHESWDIADSIWYKSKEEAIHDYEESCKQYKWYKEEWPTLEDYLNWWKKCYKRK